MRKLSRWKTKINPGVSHSLAFCFALPLPHSSVGGSPGFPQDFLSSCPGGKAKKRIPSFAFGCPMLGDEVDTDLWAKGHWMQFCDAGEGSSREGEISFLSQNCCLWEAFLSLSRQSSLYLPLASTDLTGQAVLAPSFTVRRSRVLRGNFKSRLDVYSGSCT